MFRAGKIAKKWLKKCIAGMKITSKRPYEDI